MTSLPLLPDVSMCEATDCAYNVASQCGAGAITIGDGIHPACDTYFRSNHHVHAHADKAGVGACKVSKCRYNQDFECQAASIVVRSHDQHADCSTFREV